MKSTKHKHTLGFNFYHDVIPTDWSFGAELTLSNNETFAMVVLTLHFARHMWQFRFVKQKGYYYTYD